MALQPPTNVSVSTLASDKLSFSFTKSTNDSPFSSGNQYNMRYDTDSRMGSPTTTSDFVTADGSATYSGAITGLSSGTTYYVQFQYEQSTGAQSSWAGPDSATTSVGVPSTPGAPTETSVSFEEIALSWSAASGATSYKLYYGTGTGAPSGNETIVSSGTTKTIDGLAEAQNYTFRLKATNSGGDSAYGPTFTQSTKWEDEGNLTLSANTSTTNVIGWTVPVSSAGSDSSKLYGEINDTTPDTLINTQSGTGTKSATHSSLTPGGVYSYQLRIFVGVHNNHYSTNYVETVTNIPAEPGTVSVTAKTDTTINTSWSAATGATGYKLYYGLSNNPTAPGSTQSGTTKGFGSLSAHTTYYFRIKAYNAGGDSGYSPTLAVDTTTTQAGQPSLSNVTPVSQTVSWTDPAGTVTAFLYGGTSANPTTLLATLNSALPFYNHTGLTPGTTYYYRTRTQTTYHNNLFSAYSSDRSGATATVDVPTSFGYAATSTTTITFNWTNPTYTGRTYFAATGGTPYAVQVPDYVTGTTRLIGDGDTIQGSAISIAQNSAYSLVARNYYSPSTAEHYSNYTSTFTGYTLPGPPTSVTATDLSDTEIQVSWADPAGSALSETFTIDYRIDNTGSWINATTTATGTSYVHSSLTQGTHYYYQIKTVTSAGSSTYATADDTTQTGPDPVAGDALSLGKLGYAAGVNGNATTSTSINACNGNAGTEVEFKDFYAGAVGTLSGTQYLGTGQNTTFTANFSNKGTLFNSRIGSVYGNFSWSSSDTNVATVANNSDRTCVVTATGTGTATITMIYAGRFNDHSSIPSTTRQRSVNVVW